MTYVHGHDLPKLIRSFRIGGAIVQLNALPYKLTTAFALAVA